MGFVLASVLAATGGPGSATTVVESPVTMTLDSAAYSLADTIHITITNSTDSKLAFSTYCDLFIDELREDDWVEAYRPDCTRVRVVPTRIAAYKFVAVDFPLAGYLRDDPFEDRTCRLRLRYRIVETGQGTVMSAPFTVLR